METAHPSHHQIVIVGGGSAGVSIASRLLRANAKLDVAIIEPSESHYYQPLWTLVGAGVVDKEVSHRNEADVIPSGTVWIKDSVASLDPDNNKLETAEHGSVSYDYLVLCPGIQLEWDKIEGLTDTIGKNGVCSNYDYNLVDYTWSCLKTLEGGRALFTQPATPIKCGGAPQKIMYLAADMLSQRGRLERTDVAFFTPGTVLFGVDGFRETLLKVVDRYGIDVNYKHELVSIDGDNQTARFKVTSDDGVESFKEETFDFIHVTPPQSAPTFVAQSKLANEAGWLDVDKKTLQHVAYSNIFGGGDVLGTPNAKTGAAVRKQAPVVVANLLQVIADGSIAKPDAYDGYSSCPLVTAYGRVVLAEFDYDNKPQPSFPIDQTKERYSMYLLKRYMLPWFYWNLMLKGRA